MTADTPADPDAASTSLASPIAVLAYVHQQLGSLVPFPNMPHPERLLPFIDQELVSSPSSTVFRDTLLTRLLEETTNRPPSPASSATTSPTAQTLASDTTNVTWRTYLDQVRSYVKRSKARKTIEESYTPQPNPTWPTPSTRAKKQQPTDEFKQAPLAPQYLVESRTIRDTFSRVWQELAVVAGNLLLFDPFRPYESEYSSCHNEAMIDAYVNRYALDPAVQAMTQFGQLFDAENNPEGYTPPTSDTAVTAALREHVRFKVTHQTDMPAELGYRHLSFADIRPALHTKLPDKFIKSRLLKDGDRIAQARRAEGDLEDDENMYKATRPDNEILVQAILPNGDRIWVKALTTEIKQPGVFSAHDLKSVLRDAEASWNHSHLRRQALAGKIPVREAFRAWVRDSTTSKYWTPKARHIFEEISQLWKYMAQRGHEWGIITSGLVSVILQLDWSSILTEDVTFFTIFEEDEFSFPTSEGEYKPVLAEVICILVTLNIEARIRGNADSKALGLRMQQYYLDESVIPADEDEAWDEEEDQETYADSEEEQLPVRIQVYDRHLQPASPSASPPFFPTTSPPRRSSSAEGAQRDTDTSHPRAEEHSAPMQPPSTQQPDDLYLRKWNKIVQKLLPTPVEAGFRYHKDQAQLEHDIATAILEYRHSESEDSDPITSLRNNIASTAILAALSLPVSRPARQRQKRMRTVQHYEDTEDKLLTPPDSCPGTFPVPEFPPHKRRRLDSPSPSYPA